MSFIVIKTVLHDNREFQAHIICYSEETTLFFKGFKMVAIENPKKTKVFNCVSSVLCLIVVMNRSFHHKFLEIVALKLKKIFIENYHNKFSTKQKRDSLKQY